MAKGTADAAGMQHALHVADFYNYLAIKNRHSHVLYFHYQARRRLFRLLSGADLRAEKLAKDRAYNQRRGGLYLIAVELAQAGALKVA